jgi:hypothetical protein
VKNIKTNNFSNRLSISVLMCLLIFALILLIPVYVFAEGTDDEGSGSSADTMDAGNTGAEITTSTIDNEDVSGSFNTPSGESAFTAPDDSPGSIGSTTPNADPLPLESEAPASNSDTTPESQPPADSSSGDFPTANTGDSAVNNPPNMEGIPGASTTGVVEGNSYTAEITSERVLASGTDNTSFTIEFTETSSIMKLGSVQLTLPEGFTNLDLVADSIQASGEKKWFGNVVDLVLSLWAQDEASYLGADESVRASFLTTTPSETGIYTLETKAWTDNAAHDQFNDEGAVVNKNNMAQGYADPTVGVFTINSPVVINTAEGLAHLSTLTNQADLAKEYELSADIDLDVYTNWKPIGSLDKPFTGTFDGQNHTISNLTINRPDEDYIGLFGRNTGMISDLTLSSVDVVGRFFVGSLAGRNEGTIKDVMADGTVSGVSVVGGIVGGSGPERDPDGGFGYSSADFYGEMIDTQSNVQVTGASTVGGLIGGTYGIIKNCSSSGAITVGQEDYFQSWALGDYWALMDYHEAYMIFDGGFGGLVGSLKGYGLVEDSHATGNVEGKHAVGGLVGNILGTGWILSLPETSIARSYAIGNVSSYFDETWAYSHNSVGGLVGYNFSGLIRDSYATGSVSGDIILGGLVGYNDGVIINSYATGLITSDSDRTGGLVGFNADTIINSYYDSTTTGQLDTGKGFGKTTAELTAGIPSLYIYDGWHTDVWTFSNAGYPQLSPDPTPPAPQTPQSHIFTGGNGTSVNPYVVANLADLNAVRLYPDAHFLQTANISLLSIDWQPIGNKMDPFTGVYNGDGYTISNLTINEPNINYGGLFGYTGGTAELKNINLTNAYLNGNYYIGGLVGFLHGDWRGYQLISGEFVLDYDTAYVISCATAGTIIGNSHVGGLVGYSTSAYTGGIGATNLTVIIDSSSSAAVEGYNSVGGLIGSNGAALTNSSATGSVTGLSRYNSYKGFDWYDQSSTVGGLAGYSAGVINNCHAGGNVSGFTDVGGLAGYVGSSVSNSYATGEVEGYKFVGGLLGSVRDSTTIISNSYATGNVTGTVAANIDPRWDSGQTDLLSGNGYHSGSGSVGGLIGRNEAQVNDCYAQGIVTGITGVGGLAGVNLGDINASHADGRVIGDWGVGGLVGINWLGSINNSYATGHVTGNRFVGQLIGFNYGFDSITGPSVDVGFMGFVIPSLPLTGTTPQSFMNQTIPALQKLVTSGFVTNGTLANLISAKQAFGYALQLYNELKTSLSSEELATVETNLAVIWAAIKALEASLQARAGEAVDLGTLIEAYNQAKAVLEANRSLLAPDQIAYATAILGEIGSLISSLSQQST